MGKKLIKKGPKSGKIHPKFTQNRTFLATYTPDMVIIWPHMACLPIFLSHTTYIAISHLIWAQMAAR